VSSGVCLVGSSRVADLVISCSSQCQSERTRHGCILGCALPWVSRRSALRDWLDADEKLCAHSPGIGPIVSNVVSLID
jgi:hypothetical protein